MSLSIAVGPSDHAKGSSHARVTLVEYGDYQCPQCGAAYPEVKALQQALGRELRFVFRNMPLDEIHPQAQRAAQCAEAAGAQHRFWQMHDALFEHQAELGPKLMQSLAVLLELDVNRFETDLETGRYRERVQRDFMGAVRSGAAGTPTFFIDGERYDGRPDARSLLEAMTVAPSAGRLGPRVGQRSRG